MRDGLVAIQRQNNLTHLMQSQNSVLLKQMVQNLCMFLMYVPNEIDENKERFFMKEEIIFNQSETVRSITVELLESIPESDWDVIPKGFRNNIRWNAGHILTIQDWFANSFRSLSENLPNKYWDYFAKDTSPADWTDDPPSKEVLLKLLKEQHVWIHTTCK
ncbi:DinB family protein, partial [Priestia megaterium]